MPFSAFAGLVRFDPVVSQHLDGTHDAEVERAVNATDLFSETVQLLVSPRGGAVETVLITR